MRNGMHIALDTNVLIYFLERHSQFGAAAEKLLEAVAKGSFKGHCSELVLLELLSSPHVDRSLEMKILEFVSQSGLSLQPLNTTVLHLAARLRRANPALRTPDALHIASAIVADCTQFVTNDEHLVKQSFKQLEIVSLTNFSL